MREGRREEEEDVVVGWTMVAVDAFFLESAALDAEVITGFFVLAVDVVVVGFVRTELATETFGAGPRDALPDRTGVVPPTDLPALLAFREYSGL